MDFFKLKGIAFENFKLFLLKSVPIWIYTKYLNVVFTPKL